LHRNFQVPVAAGFGRIEWPKWHKMTISNYSSFWVFVFLRYPSFGYWSLGMSVFWNVGHLCMSVFWVPVFCWVAPKKPSVEGRKFKKSKMMLSVWIQAGIYRLFCSLFYWRFDEMFVLDLWRFSLSLCLVQNRLHNVLDMDGVFCSLWCMHWGSEVTGTGTKQNIVHHLVAEINALLWRSHQYSLILMQIRCFRFNGAT
jgi:hypothetical protein